jgi:hypothetical protein
MTSVFCEIGCMLKRWPIGYLSFCLTLTVIAGRDGCTCPNGGCNWLVHNAFGFGYFDHTGHVRGLHGKSLPEEWQRLNPVPPRISRSRFMLLDGLAMTRPDRSICDLEVDVPPFVVRRHPSIAAVLPRDPLTVAKSISPATKNSTVDKMASRWLPAVR